MLAPWLSIKILNRNVYNWLFSLWIMSYSEFRKKELEHAKLHNYGFGMIKQAVFEAAILSGYFLKNTFITANIITSLNLILWLLIPLLFLKGSFALAIIAIFAMIAVNFLDFIDGIVARAQGTGSRGGGYFDTFMHAVTIPWICTLFGYYVYMRTGMIIDLFSGMIIGLWYPYYFLFEALAVYVLVHSPRPIPYKMDDLSVKTKKQKKIDVVEIIKKIISRIYGPPEMFWIFLVVLVLGIASYYLRIFAVVAILSVLYKFYKNYKHLRQIK